MSEDCKGKLTSKEIEILTLVAKGYKNKEIAQQLNVCIRTVESHLEHVYRKLGASGRTSAVLLAVSNNWIQI